MKNLKYWLAVALMGQASYSFAQYETDALRFSRTQFGGTARTLGSGGANVAVGADLSNLVSNPAGLGLFQRSEFSFSPGLGLDQTRSRAFGNQTTDARNRLHVASLGAVFANRRPDGDGSPWRGGSLAVGLTRINDFNTTFRYRGRPEVSQDILQRLSEDRGLDLDDLAYETFLTDVYTGRNGADSTGLSAPFRNTGRLDQDETVVTTGSQTQFDIGYGASYLDKLYVGGSFGIVSVRYNSTSTLGATDPTPINNADPGTSFASLTLRDVLETRGSGVNFKVGAIYRPNDVVRIGASVQTPTFMTLSETYSSSLKATFDKPVTVDGQSYSSADAKTDPGQFDYVLTSPFRASGGVAVVAGKYGFFSGDVEYVNYGQARLSNDSESTLGEYDFGPTNDAVRRLYQSAVNLRLGAEGRFDIFRVRAGYARYGDPYANSDFDRTQQYYTGGIGVRQKNAFFDLAGVYSKANRFYQPYTLADDSQPRVQVEGSRFTTTVTLGLLF
ncbi:OmpP1/FadL family transporter [Hymenobacter sp. B81]|uniref:OmpP1/FadL family transporter n=1 Tax=Hymenobacter sp. B81 TaxID=3344878 RepID=UPI0037DDBE68